MVLFSVSWVAQIILLLSLAVCAVTDILYRKISELLLIFTVIILLILHFSWINIGIGVLYSIPWVIGTITHKAGTGDAEMAAVVGLGMGGYGLLAIWIGLTFGLLTQRFWIIWSGPQVSNDERRLAPMGVYFAFGTLITIFIEPFLRFFFSTQIW